MQENMEDLRVVAPEDMPKGEVEAYIQRGREKFGDKLTGIEIKVAEDDKNFVEIAYDTQPTKFQRLRRITGYLVGTLDRWNDGKRAEEHDRVKHGME